MKYLKVYKRLLIVCLLMLKLFLPVHAQESEKQKKFEKAYPLHSSQAVFIINRLGDVVVKNWEQKEVKAEVTITARAADETAAQAILNAVSVKSTNDKDSVIFATNIMENTQAGKKGISVNYTVYVPAACRLSINNRIGNIIVPSRDGITNINQLIGDLTIGDLPNGGDIDTKIGKVIAGTLNNMKLKIAHSDVSIKGLSGNISSDFFICKQLNIGLMPGLKKLDLKLAYSKDAIITFPPSFNGSFNIETKYGKLDNKTPFKINQVSPEVEYGFTFLRKYKGESGSGKVPVFISSDFSNLILQ